MSRRTILAALRTASCCFATSTALAQADINAAAAQVEPRVNSPQFTVDEKYMKTGVKALVNVALEYLRAGGGKPAVQ